MTNTFNDPEANGDGAAVAHAPSAAAIPPKKIRRATSEKAPGGKILLIYASHGQSTSPWQMDCPEGEYGVA